MSNERVKIIFYALVVLCQAEEVKYTYVYECVCVWSRMMKYKRREKDVIHFDDDDGSCNDMMMIIIASKKGWIEKEETGNFSVDFPRISNESSFILLASSSEKKTFFLCTCKINSKRQKLNRTKKTDRVESGESHSLQSQNPYVLTSVLFF